MIKSQKQNEKKKFSTLLTLKTRDRTVNPNPK
jgi:hypothetical protein